MDLQLVKVLLPDYSLQWNWRILASGINKRSGFGAPKNAVLLLHSNQQIYFMLDLFQILQAILAAPTRDAFDNATFQEVQIVSSNVLYWLNARILVVVASYLYLQRINWT